MMIVHRQLCLLARSGGGAGCIRRAPGRSSCLCLVRGCEPLGEKCSVVLHPADQRRATCPLPGEAEEEETGNVGHSATVSQSPVRVKDRKIDPGVVGAATVSALKRRGAGPCGWLRGP